MDGDMVLPQFLNMSIYYFFVIWRNEAILCIVGKKNYVLLRKNFIENFYIYQILKIKAFSYILSLIVFLVLF